MKIGILTFHTPINYGAVLQVYALQKYLKDKFPAAEVKVIDFKTEEHIKKYSLFIKFRKNLIKYFYYQFFVLVKYNKLRERVESFRRFVTDELSLTERFSTVDGFLNNVPEMDIYIVGSDQVFHPNSQYYRVFYMDFDAKKSIKLAYAPSFGMSDFNDAVKDKLQSLLLDFDNLSCREKEGAEFLSETTGKKVEHVLDPTFLLSREEWQKVLVKPNISKPYIFIYDLNGGQDLVRIANKIKQQTGFSIICQTQKAHARYGVDELLFNVGPKEMVGYISGASYVITDSFHGVAFSVSFQKEFFTYVAMPKASGRVRSLLNSLNLSDRIIENGKSSEFTFERLKLPQYEQILESKRQLSQAYLLDSIAAKKESYSE